LSFWICWNYGKRKSTGKSACATKNKTPRMSRGALVNGDNVSQGSEANQEFGAEKQTSKANKEKSKP
jgi:hypothetical protein